MKRQYDADWVHWWAVMLAALVFFVGVGVHVYVKNMKAEHAHQVTRWADRYELLRLETEFMARYMVSAFSQIEAITFGNEPDGIPVEYFYREDMPPIEVLEVRFPEVIDVAVE